MTTPNINTFACISGLGNTKRQYKDRLDDVFNVKDFGANGDNTGDDSTAIALAISTMYANGGGEVVIPAGIYPCGSEIGLGGGSVAGVGRITGAGMSATKLIGQVNTGFLMNMPYQNNGVGQISNMTITNSSTKIGTGALRYAQANAQGLLYNLALGGMHSLDCGWNCFNTTAIGILSEGTGILTSPYGSIGITSGGINIIGYRESASHEIGLTMVGFNSMFAKGISIEETPIGIVVGYYVGYALGTITGPDGAKVLTVSGTLYPPKASTVDPLLNGDNILTDGVDPRLNFMTVVFPQLSGTPNEQGTYRITGADGVTISTPQPIQIRRRWPAAGFSISDFQTEGDGIGIYLFSAGAGKLSSINITGQINQGITNQYGGILTGENTSSPQAGLFVDQASGITIDGCNFHSHTTKAAVQFNGLNALVKGVTFINCNATTGGDGVTDANAFIDNGAGTTLATTSGSGTTLNFTPGTLPASVTAGPLPGIPVQDATHSGGLSQSTYVVTANNGTGVVTINQAITGSFVNGDTIKFCVPSGVAGNILTVQTISNTIGRGTSGGTAVQGAGIPTGTSTPMVTDQVNGYFNGGQGNNQYTLIKADLTALSINVGRIVMTLLNGKSWGIDNLTGLEGLHPFTKAGVRFIYSNACDHDLQMDFANLPGLFGVAVDEGAKIGDTYPIKNAAASTGTAIATFGAPATGGGTADVLLRCSAIVGGATNGATAAGVNVLNFAATPTGTVAGMAVSNGDNFNGPFTQTIADNTYVVSTTGTTVTLNNNVMGVGVANGDVIRFYQWTVCGV